MTNPSRSTSEILETVAKLIGEVIGDDDFLGVPIEMSTSFSEDLELESIEFVALAEQLGVHYGGGVDFVGWIATKDLDEIIGLTVGQLVEFISTCPE